MEKFIRIQLQGDKGRGTKEERDGGVRVALGKGTDEWFPWGLPTSEPKPGPQPVEKRWNTEPCGRDQRDIFQGVHESIVPS